MRGVRQRRVVGVRSTGSPEFEVAPFKNHRALISKRFEIVAKLVESDSGLDSDGEVFFIHGENLSHPSAGQHDVTADEARRDGVHGADELDLGIVGIRLFDDSLDFLDGAWFLELVVRDVELDLVVPVDEARHVGCVEC